MSSRSGALARAVGGLRAFVGSRSATQRIGAVTVAAVLVTAPFGGLEKAEEGAYGPLHLGHRYDIGPFYLTVDKVVTLPDLLPAIEPERKGDRLLVVEVTITNHVDEPLAASLAIAVLGGEHTGAIPWPDDVESAQEFGHPPPTTAEPRTFNVADGTRMDTETVNPGQTYQLAVVVEQEPGWTPDDFILSVQGLVYDEQDPTTLDPGHWTQRTYIARGHVPVEVKS